MSAMPTNDILASLGIDPHLGETSLELSASGQMADPAGGRVVLCGAETYRSFHRVLEAESAGAWSAIMKSGGNRLGLRLAAALDAALTAAGKPVLTGLPFEACLALLEHRVASAGWGRLKIDLTDAAQFGFIVARLENGFGVEAMGRGDGFADPMLAGLLQGFFTHISGQDLGCEELACARGGAPCCVFVITAPERLALLASGIGREPADALLARLRH